jgi:hypothetical protein
MVANCEPLEDAMIEALKDFPDNVVAFACHGHITKHDYATVLIPAIEKALRQHDKVRIYYETAADFAGIDPSAVGRTPRSASVISCGGNGSPSSLTSNGSSIP